jgi:hypothetical protein
VDNGLMVQLLTKHPLLLLLFFMIKKKHMIGYTFDISDILWATSVFPVYSLIP